MSTMHQGEQAGDEDRALQELRGHVVGSVIEPQDPLFDEARAVLQNSGSYQRREMTLEQARANFV